VYSRWKLPGEQRTVVLAAYAPDVRIQDVAEQSGRTVAAFYQWRYRMHVRPLKCTRRTLQTEGLQ
jgi:RNA polymerase sigma-70 factor (ECF subfamily)